jgi:hypothetical protein
MKKITFLILFFAVITPKLQAQEPEDFNYYQEKYNGNTAVTSFEKATLVLEINSDGELEIEEHRERRRIYLKDNAAQFAKSSISYSEHSQLTDIEAFSLLPKRKGKYKKEKVKNFSTKAEFSSGVFHNGVKSENFFYPSLSKGAVTVVNYTMKQDIPQLISSFYVGEYYPIDVYQIEIHAKKGVEMDFSYIHANEQKYRPTIEEGKKETVYRWEIRDIPGVEIEENGPDPTFYIPQIIPRVTQYTYKGTVTPVLRDEADLYRWYHSLVKKTYKEPNETLKNIVDSLVTEEDDDLERVRKIYYWVQDNVRYVAFEEGMQGFIPDDAVKVCDKRYGDCKGLTSILYSMCRYAGVEAYFAWVGTRDRPFRYKEVPTPLVDNHMILSYRYKDQFYVVDGTSNTSPVTEPTSFIQEKEVMIGIDANEFKIIEVPVKPYGYSAHRDTVWLSLDEKGLLKGKGVAHQSGYYASSTKSYLKLLSQQELERFLQNYLERGNNKCQLDTFFVSDLNSREEDLVIHYTFTLPDYANVGDGEIFLNLSLVKLYADNQMKKDRKTPYEIRFKSMDEATVILDIPEGYEVAYLPKDQSYEHELFGTKINLVQEEEKLIQTLYHYDNFLLLKPSSFKDWNKMIKVLKNIYRESIILKKIQTK